MKDGQPHMQLVGDPLDVKMFEFTEWELDEDNSTNYIA